ncbi:hypothetical protein [Pseudonocardia sp. HH130630-07]|uniref:hypothetical protein n=1 Tax=Pseudonocardia sp. HH130630-07 TaxID=1690815 RepID=UPI0012E9A0CA|nr:hypothetical protein [Pseudonocardia sp. HH130630-07]
MSAAIIIALVALLGSAGPAMAAHASSPSDAATSLSAPVTVSAPTQEPPVMPYSVHKTMDECIAAQKRLHAEKPGLFSQCFEDRYGPKKGMFTLWAKG